MFFVIIGTRGRAKILATVQLACGNGHVAAHQVVRVTRWFTAFFLPLIPYHTKYISVCAGCGAQLQIPKDAALELVDQTPSLPPASTTPPPAGWYPDPTGVAGARWWDGTKWTEAVQPGPVAG